MGQGSQSEKKNVTEVVCANLIDGFVVRQILMGKFVFS